MGFIQWSIAAGTAIFVALVGYFQWQIARQKAVLDLFDRRHSIYLVVQRAVQTMCSSSTEFDLRREREFIENMEQAYFFFGDDVQSYLVQLLNDILEVRTADAELAGVQANSERREILNLRRAALTRIGHFLQTGQPIFARYMRFTQTMRFPAWWSKKSKR